MEINEQNVITTKGDIVANDLGKDDRRVLEITIIDPKSGSDDPIPKFIIDNGHTSGDQDKGKR